VENGLTVNEEVTYRGVINSTNAVELIRIKVDTNGRIKLLRYKWAYGRGV
jgi:hypothetical protein